jgi:DNA-binding LytR/AlgR family response regulator
MMYLYIAVCDDEEHVRLELESMLEDTCDKLNVKYEFSAFSTGAELYRQMESGAHYDLIFLDIALANDKIDGVEIGKLIREGLDDHTVAIVYMSWEKKYALQLFEISPQDFLIKPLDKEKIEKAMRKYLKIAKLWDDDFIYKAGHDVHKVKVMEIIYLESSGRKVIIHLTGDREISFYGTLKKIYDEQLKKHDFLRIHNAYAINYHFVKSLQYEEVTLQEKNIQLPISQARRKEVRDAYLAIRIRQSR